MGNKSELIQQYNEISAKSNALNAKIAELSEALKNLNNVSTTVDYILKNHENIKNDYNLAGTAYKNETEAEQTTVKIASEKFSKYKEDIAGQLNAKILLLGFEAAACRTSMNTLSILIDMAKE